MTHQDRPSAVEASSVAIAEGQARRALLIVNRASRRGDAGVAEAIETLKARAVHLVPARCESARDVSACIKAHRGVVDSVILAGGDGTVNAAGQALVETGLPLGVLPIGTANDFARSVGIPLDLVAAAQLVGDGLTHAIDIGDVNGHAFFNVASIGLAAELAKSLTRADKRRFGRFSYALSAFKVLSKAEAFHATLVLGDERVRVRTMQIAVGNGRFYGGGNVVVSDARIDDGYLDLYSLEFAQVWRMALMLPSFKSGGHVSLRDVRTARGGTFEVLTRRPRPVNADGELVTQTPARFTQKRGAVRVFVSAPAASLAITP